MFNLTRKGLWAHKLRFVLTGLAVVLGVAFMAGTMILTDTMGKTFDGLFATANEGIDVVVHRTTGVDSDGGIDVQERVDASLVDRSGRRRRRRRRRLDRGLRPARRTRRHAAPHRDGIGGTIGANWIDDERLNPFALSAGRAPEGPTEVVLDQATVDDEGWALGDTVGVLAKDATTDDDPRRHRHLRRHRRHPRLHRGRHRRRHRPGDVRPARRLRRHRRGRRTAPTTNDELADRHRRPAVGSDDLEVLTGDADTADKQADVQGGHELLQHVPHGVRLHRPVRRDVHHLQHLLDHRRPAHAGDGDAPGRRRQPPPGAALGAARVGHRRARSPRPSASAPAWACRSACGRSSERSASTSRAATWSSRPARSSRPSWSASP